MGQTFPVELALSVIQFCHFACILVAVLQFDSWRSCRAIHEISYSCVCCGALQLSGTVSSMLYSLSTLVLESRCMHVPRLLAHASIISQCASAGKTIVLVWIKLQLLADVYQHLATLAPKYQICINSKRESVRLWSLKLAPNAWSD